MPRLALYTFGVLKAPTGSESLVDFVAMAPSVFAEAAASKGFYGHATAARPDLAGKSKFGEDFGRWGIAVAPRFYDGYSKPGEETMITTLSLWRDIEVAWQFAYGGLHRAALARRSDWFHKPQWPGYVLWWSKDEKCRHRRRAPGSLKRSPTTVQPATRSPSPHASIHRVRRSGKSYRKRGSGRNIGDISLGSSRDRTSSPRRYLRSEDQGKFK